MLPPGKPSNLDLFFGIASDGHIARLDTHGECSPSTGAVAGDEGYLDIASHTSARVSTISETAREYANLGFAYVGIASGTGVGMD
jgi:hypothetical protein